MLRKPSHFKRKLLGKLAVEYIFSIFQSDVESTEVIAELKVVEENLVVAFEAPFKRLYFYDWRTDEGKSMCPHRDYADFAFLRHDILCYPTPEDTSLDVYYIPSSHDGGPVRRIQALSLAQDVDPFTEYSWINIRNTGTPLFGDFLPGYVSHNLPFIEPPRKKLIILEICSTLEAMSSLFLVVHRKSLLKRLPPEECWSSGPEPDPIDFEEWGSEITLLLNLPWSSEFNIIISCGQRLINYHTPRGKEDSTAVMDFNPYYIRKAQATTSYASVHHKPGSLPYTVATLPEWITNGALELVGTGIVSATCAYPDENLHQFQITLLDVHFGDT